MRKPPVTNGNAAATAVPVTNGNRNPGGLSERELALVNSLLPAVRQFTEGRIAQSEAPRRYEIAPSVTVPAPQVTNNIDLRPIAKALTEMFKWVQVLNERPTPIVNKVDTDVRPLAMALVEIGKMFAGVVEKLETLIQKIEDKPDPVFHLNPTIQAAPAQVEISPAPAVHPAKVVIQAPRRPQRKFHIHHGEDGRTTVTEEYLPEDEG